jgi:hypothetical protein
VEYKYLTWFLVPSSIHRSIIIHAKDAMAESQGRRTVLITGYVEILPIYGKPRACSGERVPFEG